MDPRTVVTAWCEAMNRHDPDAVAACFSTGCAFTDHGTGQHTRGREAVREGVAEWLGAISALRIEVRFLACGPVYAQQWIMHGVHTGDLPGLAATARSFAVHGSGHGEVRGGEIVACDLYWNMADFMTQVDALARVGTTGRWSA